VRPGLWDIWFFKDKSSLGRRLERDWDKRGFYRLGFMVVMNIVFFFVERWIVLV